MSCMQKTENQRSLETERIMKYEIVQQTCRKYLNLKKENSYSDLNESSDCDNINAL